MTKRKVEQRSNGKKAAANASDAVNASPASSSKELAPSSTVSSICSDREAATGSKKMNTGYYGEGGVLPDQSSGNNSQNTTTTNEYSTQAGSGNAAGGASATDPTMGSSVVNDLMKVYENMTQSSTPQVPPAQASQQPAGQVEIPSSKYHIPPPMFTIPPMGKSDSARPSYDPSAVGQQHPQGPYQFDPPRQVKEEDSVPPSAVSIPSSIQMRGADTEQESATMVHNEESDEQSSLPSSRRKRRGSHGSSSATKQKKKPKQDGRWSKRFTWPEDLHRDFVSAIFDVGLKQSSPSTILEQMPKHEQITTERIKSHLQKYRLHRAKSKKEFISTYEASLRKMQSQGGVAGASAIGGGEVAAHLTFSESVDSGAGGGTKTMSPVASANNVSLDAANTNTSNMAGVPMNGPTPAMNAQPSNVRSAQEDNESLMLPELTETEKQSPIGSAMGYLMGLFFSLRQQLLIQRRLEQAQGIAGPVQTIGSETHMQDVYGSFANSAGPSQSISAVSDIHSEALPHQPSMRTNIEENSMMKREMQNQMALQNKMRALKEQELAKYKNNDHGEVGKAPAPYPYVGGTADAYAPKNSHMASDPGMSHVQGAGEVGGNEVSDATNQQRPHGLSFGTSADLWNSDVVDDQLFEFLMND